MILSRLLLLVFTCLQLIGLSIFLKGFLLTRQTLSQQGKIYDVWDRFPIILSDNDNSNNNNNTTHSSATTLTLPSIIPSPDAFKRVIFVVIDALRFDFMIPDPTVNEYYRNRIPIIHHLMETQPNNTLLYQFQADPPTTTMQRIKGLMTGSLPTFIDAGDNFASSSVHEDHLLVHLSKKYKQLYFMGDNTWEQLFSSVLATERTFASDSFKMFDLYTVDNRIQEQLWPLLEKDKEDNNNNNRDDKDDWEVIITHFLGVDHCGHTYGPNHSNMAIKLDEMNTILSRLINNHVDNQTLLVVMGDHGMSTEGDHGGESVEELMSGVLFYSGRKLTTIQQQRKKKEENDPIQLYFKQLLEKIYRERTIILGHDLNKITERLFYNANDYSIVPQINLVPTLSYLLQLPIPFGNLGALIPEVLLHHDQPHLHQLDILLHMAQQYRLNALQVYDYLMTYGNQTHHIGFTKEALTSVLQQLEQADKSFLNAINIYTNFHQQQQEMPLHEKSLYIDSLEATILGYDAFLSTTIKYCEGIWAQFDVGCMFLGIFILFSSTLAAIYIWLQHDQWQDLTWYQWKQVFNKFISSSWIQVLIGGMMLCAILVWVTLPIVHLSYPTWHGAFEKMGGLDLFFSMIGMTMIFFSVYFIYQFTTKSSPSLWTVVNGDGIILFIGDIVQASTLGSNSFVIWEDRGTRFIIITLCVWWLHRRMKSFHDNSEETNWLSLVLPPFLVMVWVRMTGVFGQCREEQFPYCSYIDIGYLKTLNTTTASVWTLFYFVITGIIMISLLGWMFFIIKKYHSLNRITPITWSPLFYIFVYGFCLLIVYVRMIEDIYLNIHETSLFQLLGAFDNNNEVISMTTITKIMDVYLPRCVYILCLITSFNLWMEKKRNYLNNTISCSSMWIFLNIWSTVFALIQRPIGSMIILTTPVIIYVLSLDHHSLTRLKRKPNDDNNSDNSIMIRLGILHMIGQHLFFVTGHQATFTSLPWKAAFIGFDDMHYYIGATLVTLSTFSGHFMSWFGTWVSLNNYNNNNNNNNNYNNNNHFLIYLTTLQSIPTCLSALFVFILRRHLMTWKIFAPRFLLQAITVIGVYLIYLCQ